MTAKKQLIMSSLHKKKNQIKDTIQKSRMWQATFWLLGVKWQKERYLRFVDFHKSSFFVHSIKQVIHFKNDVYPFCKWTFGLFNTQYSWYSNNFKEVACTANPTTQTHHNPQLRLFNLIFSDHCFSFTVCQTRRL